MHNAAAVLTVCSPVTFVIVVVAVLVESLAAALPVKKAPFEVIPVVELKVPFAVYLVVPPLPFVDISV